MRPSFMLNAACLALIHLAVALPTPPSKQSPPGDNPAADLQDAALAVSTPPQSPPAQPHMLPPSPSTSSQLSQRGEPELLYRKDLFYARLPELTINQQFLAKPGRRLKLYVKGSAQILALEAYMWVSANPDLNRKAGWVRGARVRPNVDNGKLVIAGRQFPVAVRFRMLFEYSAQISFRIIEDDIPLPPPPPGAPPPPPRPALPPPGPSPFGALAAVAPSRFDREWTGAGYDAFGSNYPPPAAAPPAAARPARSTAAGPGPRSWWQRFLKAIISLNHYPGEGPDGGDPELFNLGVGRAGGGLPRRWEEDVEGQ